MRYVYIPKDMGALATLKNMKGDCKDYSDLMVALDRAAGIPAKTVDGLICWIDKNGIPHTEKHFWLDSNVIL